MASLTRIILNIDRLNLRMTKDRHNQTETLPEMAVEWIRLADVMLPPLNKSRRDPRVT